MRRFSTLLLIPAILSLGAALCADDTEPDTRLTQKVTMDCAGVRLHTAIERLSKDTKVTITAGTTKSDWKVRDVPALVCARDIPLGRLLTAIADTNHLLLSSSKNDDGIASYRIWRDKKRQSELDNFKESRRAAEIAAASFDWDVLSQLRDLSEAEFEDRYYAGSDSPAASRLSAAARRAMSNIIAELEPTAKTDVLNGGAAIITYDTAPEPLKPYFREVFKSFAAAQDMYNEVRGAQADEPFTDKDLGNCWIKISVDDLRSRNELQLEAWTPGRGIVPMFGRQYENTIRRHNKDLPARPEIPKPDFETDKLSSRYVELKLSEPNGPALLDKKIKIEKPKAKKDLTYSNLLCAISKAIGYSIVADGPAARYTGYVLSHKEQLPGLFGREITVREALEFAKEGPNPEKWYLDEQSKLILGRDGAWIDRLDALVPEQLLIDTQKKLTGPGLGLDDMQPLSNLTRSQCLDWIFRCPEYPEIETISSRLVSNGSLTKVYFALSSSKRAMVKSGKSVPLGDIDEAWIDALLRQHITVEIQSHLMSARSLSAMGITAKDLLAQPLKNIEALANPSTASNLYMRLEKKALPKYESCRYLLWIEQKAEGGLKIYEDLGHELPIKVKAAKANEN